MSTVSILCPDVSSNALGRADVLARLLTPRHAVNIVGPQFGSSVWEPLRDGAGAPIRPVPMARALHLREGLRAWRKGIVPGLDGDVVYVSKPFWTSLWAARQASRHGAKVVLDIDDLETGILHQDLAALPALKRWRRRLVGLNRIHHRSAWNTWLGDRAAARVAHRTVSNHVLQERYGGLLVPHARDGRAFDPALLSRSTARQRLGWPADAPIVLFLGTPRLHKGLQDLVEGFSVIRDPEARLYIVGADRPDSVPAADARVVVLPPVPFHDAPTVLAAADVVAIPQRDTPGARGQMPAKIFDAMAMARPIVTTRVGELPVVLGSGGTVVDPGRPAALGQALQAYLDDPARARQAGAAGRRRFLENYSLDAVRPPLLELFDRLA